MWRLRVLLVSTLSCVLPAPATAMDLSQATARLSSIDKGLASCLTPLVSSHAIPPDAVRACIAAARPKDHDLRRDLNGWIPLLAESDPDREAALLIRQTLNMLRTFMNHLDRALLEAALAACERGLAAQLPGPAGLGGLGSSGFLRRGPAASAYAAKPAYAAPRPGAGGTAAALLSRPRAPLPALLATVRSQNAFLATVRSPK